ncbi:MAG: hypothetical protein JKY17_02920 [Magnetovibrio sp.]|nr:hypothetical protein [Magnetovibrio sp.]
MKTERIQLRIYKTRAEARSDASNDIELYDNPRRRHKNNNGLSSIEFEKVFKEDRKCLVN